MKKRYPARNKVRSKSHKPRRKIHHRILSLFKGDGGIYVIFVLATVMAGAFALSGGLLPSLNQNPSASSEVTIDPDSAKQSSESALQLIDIKIKPSDTPIPTPTPTKAVTPTPQACLNKIALNLVLDVSASMNNDDKINQLNTAMRNLVGQLKDDTVVGAVTFAGLTSFPNTAGSVTQLPFTKYKDNKKLVSDRLTKLTAYKGSETDGTYMRNAFQRSINNLNVDQATYANQGYNFVTIVFTDGVPETKIWDDDCVVQANGSSPVCFARKQDPRISPNLTSSMKGKVSKVYSVGVYSGQRETQTVIYNEAKKLLGAIASQSTYAKNSNSPSAIDGMFKDVLNSVCQ
jgi:hypothetical protein